MIKRLLESIGMDEDDRRALLGLACLASTLYSAVTFRWPDLPGFTLLSIVFSWCSFWTWIRWDTTPKTSTQMAAEVAEKAKKAAKNAANKAAQGRRTRAYEADPNAYQAMEREAWHEAEQEVEGPRLGKGQAIAYGTNPAAYRTLMKTKERAAAILDSKLEANEAAKYPESKGK